MFGSSAGTRWVTMVNTRPFARLTYNFCNLHVASAGTKTKAGRRKGLIIGLGIALWFTTTNPFLAQLAQIAK